MEGLQGNIYRRGVHSDTVGDDERVMLNSGIQIARVTAGQ